MRADVSRIISAGRVRRLQLGVIEIGTLVMLSDAIGDGLGQPMGVRVRILSRFRRPASRLLRALHRLTFRSRLRNSC